MWKSHIPEGKSGKWVVERFTVSEAGSAFSGFKDVRRQVPPGDYTRLVCTSGCGDTVMSDTISEYRDHRKFIGISSGRVLIAGLGLGLVLTAVAEKEEVTEITIIENSEDVVKLTWPHMSEKVKSKTTLIVGDIYNSSLIKKGDIYDYAWFDIWPAICGDNTKDFGLLKTKYRHKVKAAMFWAEKECKSENRRHKLWVKRNRRPR